MAIKIPDSEKQAVRRILALGDEELNWFFEKLDQFTPALRVDDLLAQIEGEGPIDIKSMGTFLKAAANIHFAQLKLGYTPEEFAKQLLEAVKVEHIVDEPPDGNWSGIETILSRLISAKGLQVMASAMDVASEHENTFCSARILTDLRPVFGQEVSEPPVASVLGHTLLISYHDDTGKIREFHFALDAEDLGKIEEVIGRALIKEKSLRAWIATDDNKLPVLS